MQLTLEDGRKQKCLDISWNRVTFNLWRHMVLNCYVTKTREFSLCLRRDHLVVSISYNLLSLAENQKFMLLLISVIDSSINTFHTFGERCWRIFKLSKVDIKSINNSTGSKGKLLLISFNDRKCWDSRDNWAMMHSKYLS